MNPETSLKWIRIMAGAAALIGLTTLIFIWSEGAHAEGPGFNPGNRPTIPNPFGNQPPAGAAPPQFTDDEDDDAPMPAQNAAPGFQRQGAAPGTPGGWSNQNAKNPQGGSISMGGNPNSTGIVPNAKVAAIPLDTETGDGGRDLVSDFNFPDADIMDIAKTLGKLTGKNFIFDKDVKGRISIVSNSPITVTDAWKAFLTALDVNGFALIPSGKYVRIARQRDARDKQLKTYTGDFSPDTDALITRVFPLKYIDAEEVARTFRSFMPANSRIIPYEQTNTVIVTDTGSNIAKLNKMLDILDVEGYDAGIEVIPVKWASAAELSKLIDTLIPGTTTAPTPGGTAPRFGANTNRGFAARRTKEGGIINTILADERTNTLIVHANTKGAQQVRELVARLDQKQPAQVGGGKVHVIYLQFADAEQTANTLNSITQNAGGAPKTGSAIGGTGGTTGVNPTTQSIFEGAVKVSSDKSTNSLVVNASPGDFVTVQRVVNKLDIPRDQVYVECVIMEVSLSTNFHFSANAASPISGLLSLPNGDLTNFVQNPVGLNGAVLGFKSGGSQTITVGSSNVSVSNVQGLVNALTTDGKSNVLATPQIIALDNTQATFNQTENIPILTSNAVQGAVSQSVGKQSVPLKIDITPHINKLSNFVRMDVEVDISSVEDRPLPQAVTSQAYATLDRTAKSSVVVGNEDTLVLGGLIRDKVSNVIRKIPLLGDIPILGWLFSAHDNQVDKTNLLIFMTPRIVRQYETVRAILDRKLQERDQFIEKQMGGEDLERDGRDNLIRSLPDINQLSKTYPKASAANDEDEMPAAKPVDEAPPPAGAAGAPSTGGVGAPPAPPSGAGT